MSKTAAARILKIKASQVLAVRIMKNGAVQVTYKMNGGRCSTFLSRKAFDRDALEFRIKGASDIKVLSLVGNIAQALNTKKGSLYEVDLQSRKCTCYDSAENGNICKHIHAVEAVHGRQLVSAI